MRPIHLAHVATASALALLMTACPKEKKNTEPMTMGEARSALEEASLSTQAAALTTNSIELSTNFTIGSAVKDAASEIRSFIETQLPCADITLKDATLSVTYGAKPGNCTFHGHTFTGSQSITVTKNDEAQVVVDHSWTDLSNGVLKVTGTAHVTWDFDDKYRKVEHDLTWTRLSDGRTGHGTGDRTQIPLAGGVAEGIQVDGSRTWDGKAGHWDLAIEGVQMRWQDPVPQAGTYRLATPKDRSIELSFERVDDTTIKVTLSSDDKTYAFDVKSKGQIEDGS